MHVSKTIYSIENECFITILYNQQKQYFYLQRNLIKKFMKYLQPGRIVSFSCSDEPEIHKGIKAYRIDYFLKIAVHTKRKTYTYYDIDIIREGIRDLVDQMDYILFLDLEMNMQDYYSIPNFKQEIIECGYYLTNRSGEVLEVDHLYIKPTLFKKITKRTIKFLGYHQQKLDSAMEYKEFYDRLQYLHETYHPHLIVWGKSDVITIRNSFIYNNKKPISLHFVDLLQLHHNYFNYKESPGLFKMWEAYYGKELPKQAHDALEDAQMTMEVFFGFKKYMMEDKND